MREQDAKVAELVMGWKLVGAQEFDPSWTAKDVSQRMMSVPMNRLPVGAIREAEALSASAGLCGEVVLHAYEKWVAAVGIRKAAEACGIASEGRWVKSDGSDLNETDGIDYANTRPLLPEFTMDPAADYSVLQRVRETWANRDQVHFGACLSHIWCKRVSDDEYATQERVKYEPGDYSRAALAALAPTPTPTETGR